MTGMTNEELQAHIAALRAAFHADLLQASPLNCDSWDLPLAAGVLSDSVEFRIKPQPREVFILASTLEGAATSFYASPNRPADKKAIRFREVFE